MAGEPGGVDAGKHQFRGYLGAGVRRADNGNAGAFEWLGTWVVGRMPLFRGGRAGVIRDEGPVAGGGDELSGFEVAGIAGELEGAVMGDVRDGDRALDAQFVAGGKPS